MAQEYGVSLELVRDVKSGSGRVPLYSNVETPPEKVYTPPLTAEQIAGRVRCIECTSTEFLGQDPPAYTAPTISQSGRQALADCGFVQYPYSRAFTDTGQAEIGELMALNPNLRWVLYWQFGHARQYFPGASRQLDHDVSTLLDPHKAKDIHGNPFIAWIDPDTLQVTTYWANYCDDNGDVDTALIDAHIQLLADAIEAATWKPSAMLLDHYSQAASGHWEQPEQGGPLDLLYDVRQPSVAYVDDPAQQALFLAQQVYFQNRMREVFSDDFLIFPNGNGAWPNTEPTIQAISHGWFLEGFGTSPWSFCNDPDETMELIWTACNTPGMYDIFPGRTFPLVATDLRPQYELDDARADLGRATALIFDGWWKYRPMSDPPNSVPVEADFTDAAWDALVAEVGTPTGDATRETYGTLLKYYRDFTGGRLWIVIDSSNLSYTQIVHTGTEDGVAPVTSSRVAASGVEAVYAECDTDELAEIQCRAHQRGTYYTGVWTADFKTTGHRAGVPVVVGRYDVDVRTRDLFGNTSSWQPCGSANSEEDITPGG